MKPKQRKTAAAAVVLLNLILLAICGWAVFTLLRPSEEPPSSQPESSQESSLPSRPASAEPSSLPPEESSAPELILPQGLALTDQFGGSYERALEILDGMTLSQKLGQLILCGVPDKGALSFVETFQPGGFVLFAKDFQDLSPQDVQSILAEYQSLSDIPMVFSVDEEGGEVVRASKFTSLRDTPFPSPQTLYAQGGLQALADDAAEKSAFLLNLGVQWNLAPVCDIAPDKSAYIYNRTFGLPAAQTAECVKTAVEAMEAAGISSCLKHFPGYGGNADTHTGTAVDDRSLDTFRQEDFLPFQAGIDAGADAVLVSHNIVTAMDPDRPASLSPEVHRLLREELGFTGIVLTDALEMDAIQNFSGAENPAVLALQARNDLILYRDGAAAYHALEDAWNAGTITSQQVDAAVLRVLAWKLEKGILQ